MPDLFVGVLIGFVCGFAGALGWASWMIRKSKAQRRRQWPTLTSIYDDIQGG